MCKESESTDLRRQAVQHFSEACLDRAGGIGAALKKIYDDTVAEPVPDDMAKLVGGLK